MLRKILRQAMFGVINMITKIILFILRLDSIEVMNKKRESIVKYMYFAAGGFFESLSKDGHTFSAVKIITALH